MFAPIVTILQCRSAAKLGVRSSFLFLHWLGEEVEVSWAGEVWNKLIFLLEQYGSSEIPYH